MSAGQDGARIVVTARGSGLDSPVDPRLGRASHFLLVEVASGELVEAVDNGAGVAAMQGAGVQAAETIARLGAAAVVTGHCGPKAFRALSAAGVEIYTGAEGTVAEAVQSFRDGQLDRADGADVHGHWA